MVAMIAPTMLYSIPHHNGGDGSTVHAVVGTMVVYMMVSTTVLVSTHHPVVLMVMYSVHPTT